MQSIINYLLMSTVMTSRLYQGALLLLSLCVFHWLGLYSISDLMGANLAMSTELATLFIYVAILSFMLTYSLHLMTAYSKGVDDTDTSAEKRFHDQEEMTMTMGADEDSHQDDIVVCCSSCGVFEDEDTQLKTCDACDLVQYCSDDCQKEHRQAHEESCQKRAVELHDKILFQQPEGTHIGDCPICLLPLSDDISMFVMESCCSTFICNGCSHANRQRELEDNLPQKCPFCRVTPPETNEEGEVRKMKRVEASDPVALCEVGKKHYHEGDFSAAFEYWTRAIEGEGPGAVDAHDNLAIMYQQGLGGAEKDEEKQLYHLEVAAIAGHPTARYSLANYEGRHGRDDRAVKHLIIAVKQGSSDAIQTLKKMYGQGMIKKEGFAACLRVYQTAVETTKSPQREEAAKSVAQGLLPGEQLQTQMQSQTQRQRPLDSNRAVNGRRGRGGKKTSKKRKVTQAKQHEGQKASSSSTTTIWKEPSKKLC
mmetsp:Transcript_5917/g.9154  ORF Transcript_5917/g.9154 Transcript_5917/m.9154 type:complete len:480 (-) Transcript_5917:131-1570(-)